MEKEMTIATFVERFQRGDFENEYRSVQIEAGWFDWFCKDSSLAKKTKVLGRCVESIMDSPRFNKNTTYVFFKNNCPCIGPLYDQFSICDIQTRDVLFCCQHLMKGSHGAEKAHWEVYCPKNDFHEPIVKGDWKEVKKWFMYE